MHHREQRLCRDIRLLGELRPPLCEMAEENLEKLSALLDDVGLRR